MTTPERIDTVTEGEDAFASRVVLSFPEELSDWARQQIDTDRYRGYFRRTLGDVAVGDVTEEFVDIGCCGSNLDIPFRVESIDGPGRVGPDTVIDYTTRDAPIDGGWKVQSADGPT